MEGRRVCLDFGGGLAPKPGFLSVDIISEADKVLNLDLKGLMLPWPDNSIDEACAYQFIEHVEHIIPFMNEVYRILKPGARFEISTPYANTNESLQDPTHKRQYVEQSFLYFTAGSPYEKEQREYGIKARFNIERLERGTGVDEWQLFAVLVK